MDRLGVMPGCEVRLSLESLLGHSLPTLRLPSGLAERGKAFERTLDGFDALVVHREIDHLGGVLFIERVEDPAELHTESSARSG